MWTYRFRQLAEQEVEIAELTSDANDLEGEQLEDRWVFDYVLAELKEQHRELQIQIAYDALKSLDKLFWEALYSGNGTASRAKKLLKSMEMQVLFLVQHDCEMLKCLDEPENIKVFEKHIMQLYSYLNFRKRYLERATEETVELFITEQTQAQLGQID